jgi:hypothetical protein
MLYSVQCRDRPPTGEHGTVLQRAIAARLEDVPGILDWVDDDRSEFFERDDDGLDDLVGAGILFP